MKQMFFILAVIVCSSLYGQNVGINKTNPNQSLDVNGNVNVDGNIMINGNAGQPGQVLRTASSGATAWANLGDYTYVASFTQNGVFNVPVGITRVLIEAWGAGGGGSSGGGGGGGMYLISIQDVTPGQVLTVTLGVGGAKATTNPGAASDGSITTVTGSLPFSGLTAAGGKGAFSTTPGYSIRYGYSNINLVQIPGQCGDANVFSYNQKNSTTYAITRKYGDGGATGPDFMKRNQGQTISYNENTGSTIESNSPTFAPYPGGGGGGGSFGQDGANGMVNIWY